MLNGLTIEEKGMDDMRDFFEYLGALATGSFCGVGVFLIFMGEFDAGLGSVVCGAFIGFFTVETASRR